MGQRRIRSLAFAFGMCASEIAGQSTARDSAGITIVTSVTPAAPLSVIALGPIPRVILGADSGAGEPPWRIRTVSVLTGGRIVIADGATGQLRYYSPTGAFEYARGGLGQGPGQIPAMVRVRRVAGDTLAVITGRASVARFDGLGSMVDSAPPPAPVGPPRFIIVELLATGHEVLAVPGPMEERSKGER